MSQLGARLQICNEELVNLIENMRKNLEDIESEIDSDEKQKAILTAQIEELSLSLDKVNESLKEKIAMKNGYCQIVNEAETAYMKDRKVDNCQ
ncbi:uncharacterized protein LOC142319277 isoform X2 [Lycorma delicatula]|uniref:uncharacterized protein LOC142319277 isoform X2 n=1 Tax=Lycorma delicatula TaxID=130591 RepID=UPI003F50EBFA